MTRHLMILMLVLTAPIIAISSEMVRADGPSPCSSISEGSIELRSTYARHLRDPHTVAVYGGIATIPTGTLGFVNEGGTLPNTVHVCWGAAFIRRHDGLFVTVNVFEANVPFAAVADLHIEP